MSASTTSDVILEMRDITKTFPGVKALSVAAKLGRRPFDVHVEIDVGMHRVGVSTPDKAVALAHAISEAPHLNFSGVMFYPGHIRQRVDEQAAACRFRDCRHVDEPGCAVRATLDPQRLRSWHKLQREAQRDTMSALDRQRQLSEWERCTPVPRARRGRPAHRAAPARETRAARVPPWRSRRRRPAPPSPRDPARLPWRRIRTRPAGCSRR